MEPSSWYFSEAPTVHFRQQALASISSHAVLAQAFGLHLPSEGGGGELLSCFIGPPTHSSNTVCVYIYMHADTVKASRLLLGLRRAQNQGCLFQGSQQPPVPCTIRRPKHMGSATCVAPRLLAQGLCEPQRALQTSTKRKPGSRSYHGRLYQGSAKTRPPQEPRGSHEGLRKSQQRPHEPTRTANCWPHKVVTSFVLPIVLAWLPERRQRMFILRQSLKRQLCPGSLTARAEPKDQAW